MARSVAQVGALVSATVLIGIGMGGFVDGIVLHQILQWHHMLSSSLAPTDVVALKVNMVWDGLFHALTWLTTLVGLVLLWRVGKRADVAWSTRVFAGSLLLGWGLFNLVEGIIDHQVLGIHHVHPGRDQLAWDLGFLAFGAALMIAGWMVMRAGREERTARGGTPVLSRATRAA
jgi:uncharacterized membrane protein